MKIGDKIICLSVGWWYCITEGKHYTIVNIRKEAHAHPFRLEEISYCIIDDNGKKLNLDKKKFNMYFYNETDVRRRKLKKIKIRRGR
jgi:hypothetical protein